MSKANEKKLTEAKERMKSLVSGKKDAEIVNTLIEAGAEINPKEVGETKLEPSKDGQVFEVSPNSSENLKMEGKPPVTGASFKSSPNSLRDVNKGDEWYTDDTETWMAKREEERKAKLKVWLDSKSKDPRS